MNLFRDRVGKKEKPVMGLHGPHFLFHHALNVSARVCVQHLRVIKK